MPRPYKARRCVCRRETPASPSRRVERQGDAGVAPAGDAAFKMPIKFVFTYEAELRSIFNSERIPTHGLASAAAMTDRTNNAFARKDVKESYMRRWLFPLLAIA